MEKLSKEYCLLIEDIALVIEDRANLSPLAARIYASLILASNEGMTFDDITVLNQASKSSVSNNMNVLIKLKYIEYYTKPGQRKRFFKASDLYLKTALEKYNELFDKEIKVVEKINDFNKKNNPEKFKKEESFGSLYQEHLNATKEGFKNKINQISNLIT